jgi:hypothetical protein
MTQDEAEVLATKEFIATVVASVESLRIYPRLSVHLDRVLLVLLLRCVRTAQSVCTLVEQQLGDEGFVLSRTVLELCLNTYFIANIDSEYRARLYLEYFGKDRENLAKVIARYQPSATNSFSPDHELLLSMARQFKNPHKWNAEGLAGMAREKAQWNDGEEPAATEYWYDVIYKSLSHECHGTCVAAHPDLREINYSHTGNYSPFTFWKNRASGANASKAVVNAFIFTAECVRFALHGLGQIDVPEDIRTKRKVVEEIFNRRGRTATDIIGLRREGC